MYAVSQIDYYDDELDDYYDFELDDYYDFDDTHLSSLYQYYMDGKDSRYQYSKKRGLILKFPKGIEEIRSLTILEGCSDIIFPSSVRKVSIDCLASGAWKQVTFKGNVPEIYGDKSCLWHEDGYLKLGGGSAGFRVKRGQKKKLLEQLTAGTDITEDQKKELADSITIF